MNSPKPARSPAPPRRLEEVEQARVVMWSTKPSVREVMPQLRWLHHSPNGGLRSAFTGAQLKAMGVKPGFPDLILPVRSPLGTYPGLVIEMKSSKGTTSLEQKAWLDHLQTQGWSVHVARSAPQAREILCFYLGKVPDKVPALHEPNKP